MFIFKSMHNFSPEHIARLLKNDLPGKRSHLKMMPPGRELTVRHQDMDLLKYSSVLLLLFPWKDEIYTCLTKRAAAMKNHPGQISLPGGRIEEGESPEVTALRETREEVGVSPLDVRLLGRLSELYVQVSRFTIFPYVGWLDKKPDFVLNEAEAEKLILFPIQQFHRQREVRITRLDTFSGPLDVPYYPFDGEVIWGATAMILTEFLDLLGHPRLVPTSR